MRFGLLREFIKRADDILAPELGAKLCDCDVSIGNDYINIESKNHDLNLTLSEEEEKYREKDQFTEVYLIRIVGCDDVTSFSMPLTANELALVERISVLSQTYSESACMPVLKIIGEEETA